MDAGYLFAQGAVLLAGRKLRRGEVTLDHAEAVRALSAFATMISNAELLRVYWYDGTSSGPTAQHLTLAHLPNVKVRLGLVNSFGEQKGVDSLIVTDMITLAQNRAMSDAVLLSGDEDIRVGVQQAQEYGVRVHLLGIKPSSGSQSVLLLQEADTTHEWDDTTVSKFLSCQPRPVELAAALPIEEVDVDLVGAMGPNPDVDLLDNLAGSVAESIQATEIEAILEVYEQTHLLPRDIDVRLLTGSRSRLGRDLDPDEKRRLRMAFVDASRLRLAELT